MYIILENQFTLVLPLEIRLVLYFSSFCSDDKNNNKKRRRERKEREREKKEREREQTEGKVNKQLGHLGEPRVMACVPEVWHL